MKLGKFQRSKQTYQDLYWKVHDCALSFVLRSYTMHELRFPGADPGFFLGGGAPLRNDITDRWSEQILKVDTKKKASSQGGCVPPAPSAPPRSAPDFYWLIFQYGVNSYKLCFVQGQDQKREQKYTTKKFVGFHNHSPLLAMHFHPIRYKPKPSGTYLHTLDIITSCFCRFPW